MITTVLAPGALEPADLCCIQEMEMKDFVKFCKNCKFVDSTLPPAVADAWQHVITCHRGKE